MKYIITITVFLFCVVSCRNKDDDYEQYHRGFFNCLSIMQHRYADKLPVPAAQPYSDEASKSFKDGVDLYNHWDTSYLVNFNKVYGGIMTIHAFGTNDLPPSDTIVWDGKKVIFYGDTWDTTGAWSYDTTITIKHHIK